MKWIISQSSYLGSIPVHFHTGPIEASDPLDAIAKLGFTVWPEEHFRKVQRAMIEQESQTSGEKL